MIEVSYFDNAAFNPHSRVEELFEILMERINDKNELEKKIIDFENKISQTLNSILIPLLKNRIEYEPENSPYLPILKHQFETYKKFFNKTDLISDFLIDQQPKDFETILKKTYRMAASLIHPDVVNNRFHQDAQNDFYELNTAFHEKNLKTIEKLAEKYRPYQYVSPSIMAIRDVDSLQKHIEKLEGEIQNITKIIEDIKAHPTYQRYIYLENTDIRLDNLKNNLKNALSELNQMNL